MSGKVFLDTNILVYSVDQTDSRKGALAEEVIRFAAMQRNGVVSYQVLQEFLNVGFKKFKPQLSTDSASIYLAGWMNAFEIVPWSAGLMESAIQLKSQRGFSWYDCLLVAAALETGCERLYTEDLQHGQVIEGMTVVNPFA